ncbi:nickel import ATP-binding protein NikD [Arcobacter sp. FW59]|nr:nickel import ATP-binding protein NikD [Arcobacter sp. FW59]
MNTILEISNLCIYNKKEEKNLLENINLKITQGEMLGIIGESGSGKSILCKSILDLNPNYFKITGNIFFDELDILKASPKQIQQICGKKISMIMQDSVNAFNPIEKIKTQFIESLIDKKDLKNAKNDSYFWLEKVGLTDIEKVLNSYPFELSGGMLQRVMIALAFAQDSKIIIADEPTSSLDMINQKEILNIFKNLQEKEKKTVIFVSHDLGIISHLANNIAVMKKGKIVEYNDTKSLLLNPQNEYSKYLIEAHKKLFNRFNECLK